MKKERIMAPCGQVLLVETLAVGGSPDPPTTRELTMRATNR